MKRLLLVIILIMLAGIGAVAANVGGARSAVVSILGTEQRNQIVAITSGLNKRPIETADLVPMPHTGMNPVGVNTFLEQEVEISKRRQSLQMIRDAGIGWIRQQFPWQDIERPSKGRFWDENYNKSTWDKYDNIVDLANEYGVQVIARLDLPPRWAHPDNEWAASPPDRFEDYGDFVYAVVSRYKGKVRYYQLWNEPNLAVEWGRKPVDAKEYVRLLKIGYERAKEADPEAVIISAALAPTIEQSPQALDDRIYLQQMYDAGVKDSFDIMSVMAYGLRSGPDDRRLDWGDVNFSRPLLIREIMVKNGDEAKPIWTSEMGWNVQPESVKDLAIFGRVSEDLQARYTVRAFQRAAEEWPWMGVMSIWFFKRAGDQERAKSFYYFRMVEPDFTPLPVYEAVKRMANEPRMLRKGYSWADNGAMTYSGNWQKSPGSATDAGPRLSTTEAGSTIKFAFKGNDLTLVAPTGRDMGYAHVSIDGRTVMANRLVRDVSGKAFVSLLAQHEQAQERLPLATGLMNDVHEVEIQTMGPFAVDGFIVETHEPDASWWAFGIAMMWTTPIVAGIVIFIAARRRRRQQLRARGA